VIQLEPPETFTAGVINLYTREFYRDAAARLAPDGVMLQWLPVGAAPLDEERMLFRAFYDVFPHATAWRQLENGPLLLVGTKEPLRIDYRRLREKMLHYSVRRDLELCAIHDADQLLALFALDEAALAEIVRGAPAVTDDRSVLDFTMPRYLGSGFGFGALTAFAQQDGRSPWHVFVERTRYYFERRRSVVPYLTNLGDEEPQAIAARIAARTPVPVPKRWGIPEDEWRRLRP
jgi:hypothetical protein